MIDYQFVWWGLGRNGCFLMEESGGMGFFLYFLCSPAHFFLINSKDKEKINYFCK